MDILDCPGEGDLELPRRNPCLRSWGFVAVLLVAAACGTVEPVGREPGAVALHAFELARENEPTAEELERIFEPQSLERRGVALLDALSALADSPRPELLDVQHPAGADEAYADFSDENCLDLIPELTNVIILRSFSKSFSFAGLRLGLAFSSPEIIGGLMKVKDSYNVNRLTINAGVAALEDMDWMQENVRKIRKTRNDLISEL